MKTWKALRKIWITVNIFDIFVIFVAPSLVRLKQLSLMCLSLAWFDLFVIFVIFVTFLGTPSLVRLKNCYFCVYPLLDLLFSLCFGFSLFLSYLWGRLPLSFLNNWYFLCLSLAWFDLLAIFVIFVILLYLCGPLPLSALENCYSVLLSLASRYSRSHTFFAKRTWKTLLVKYELLWLSLDTNYLECKINLSWSSLSKVYLYFRFYFCSPFWRNKNSSSSFSLKNAGFSTQAKRHVA